MADLLKASGLQGAVHDAVYLYDAVDSDIHDLYQISRAQYNVFSGSRRSEFRSFLKSRFAELDGKTAAEQLLSSNIHPSPALFKVATEELRNRNPFVLLDEQRLAYELVLHAVEKARRSKTKSVVIVSGGVGSGKSAIGLALLGELHRSGYRVMHATGSHSFTQALRRQVAKGSARQKALFRYFNSFSDAAPNELDVLICDEAHRIRETSANRFTPAGARTGRRQVEELISAAWVPVFLLDERQVVRPGEVGTVDAIQAHAQVTGIAVHTVDLDGQFRSGGSLQYERWVENLLGLGNEKAQGWTEENLFSIALAETPHQLEEFLRGKLEKGHSARITAGYCWQWSAPKTDDTLVPDVRIGTWARPWTAKGDRPAREAPSSALWATLPGGFGQVGTVYTAQGFDYDWSGVIIGPDLVYRNGRLITVRKASKDPALMKSNITDRQADLLIRNTYRVLLTRGLVGTVIYSADPATQAFLAKLLPPLPR
ncbi:DUF2075 domain-containing protein [Microbispora sp. KK1-11]|uniref:DUF2075 domain-containing protein n=1 Tax=Microbispora sp. KK1-11 TaxID=2053005 RepID=UPI0021AE97CE|nr:DUF2075 domain-containing protein [Microbispora sp. KK1-11]